MFSPEMTRADPTGAHDRAGETARDAARCAALYDEHADVIFRSLQRLGVPDEQLDDALQEVFVVVHRRLGEFEGRSSVKTWLFGIVLRVAHDFRRTARRKKTGDGGPPVDLDSLVDEAYEGQDAEVQRAEELRLLDRLLEELDDEKRAVFVLAELEQLPAQQIADALSLKLNTVYSRLRAARQAFDQAVTRYKARTRSTP